MIKPKNYYMHSYTKEELFDLANSLQKRIDKAIEYLENGYLINTRDLKRILKGDSNG